jgi:hypothetical protein
MNLSRFFVGASSVGEICIDFYKLLLDSGCNDLSGKATCYPADRNCPDVEAELGRIQSWALKFGEASRRSGEKGELMGA